MLGIGVDIENIDRFEKYSRDMPLAQRLFTANELDYCFSARQPAPHLAVRFAGKEAIIKALSSLNKGSPGYRNIEILNDEKGVPLARINKAGFEGLDIRLSLSHSRQQVIAFTIILEADAARWSHPAPGL